MKQKRLSASQMNCGSTKTCNEKGEEQQQTTVRPYKVKRLVHLDYYLARTWIPYCIPCCDPCRLLWLTITIVLEKH